mmetsp:Transcript_6509/g.7795  ORF Transcript_6509/g.7795 Transcript_6509/m.7795 type:complete len:276 (+) Transcript_6509:1438-2265(+)
MTLLPTYDELLWAYQHGGFHRGDAEGEVHHEDVAVSEHGVHADPHGYYQHQIFDPHTAEHEYILDTGDMHPADHQYQHDVEADWRGESQIHAERTHYEDHSHHMGTPFWRGDHYDDHHKIDEDFKHDTLTHAYHAGDTYAHDTSHHDGEQLKHDIEHEYDELFHMIESKTKHPVEHTDITYKTLPLDRKEHDIAHPYHSSDFRHDVTVPVVHEEDTHHGGHHMPRETVEAHHEAAVDADHYVVAAHPAVYGEEHRYMTEAPVVHNDRRYYADERI